MPSLARHVLQGIDNRDQAFFRAVQADDDLGMVVRAHIQIEHELREFIRAKAPSPKAYDARDFSYKQTVRLALILGLSKDLEGGLNGIGTLRNRFAHNPDADLTKKEADDFNNALSDLMREAIRKVYAHFSTKNPGWPKNFKELSPRDRLIFSFISLRSAVIGDHVLQVHGPDAI